VGGKNCRNCDGEIRRLQNKSCEESVGTAMESFVTGRQAWWRKCRNCVEVICQLESSVMKKCRDCDWNFFSGRQSVMKKVVELCRVICSWEIKCGQQHCRNYDGDIWLQVTESGEEGVGYLRQNCVTRRRSVVKNVSELWRGHLALGDHVLVILKP